MYAQGVGETNVGRKRDHNEDALHVDNELGLFIVSDGMGGHAAGEVASSMSVETVVQTIRDGRGLISLVREGGAEPSQLVGLVERAVLAACRAVYHRAMSTTRCRGMGCTLTLLLVVDRTGIMAHVGDTRLYLAREGQVHQLSVDHTMAAALARAGIVLAEGGKRSPYGHVLTRSVGTHEAVQVDTLILDLVPGDRFLICSDGLSQYLDDPRWLEDQLSLPQIDAIPQILVDHANNQGGQDNVTALALRIVADPPERQIAVKMSTDLHVRIAALSSVFLFENLPMAHLARVMNACELDVYDTDEIIVREGETCSKLVILVHGRLALSRAGGDVGELSPGDYAGLTALFMPRPARATLRALEPSQVLGLEPQPFRVLLEARPWLGVSLLERLGRRLSRDLERNLSERIGDETPAGVNAPGELL